MDSEVPTINEQTFKSKGNVLKASPFTTQLLNTTKNIALQFQDRSNPYRTGKHDHVLTFLNHRGPS